MPPVILAVAEVADGAPTKLSTEVATLARVLAEAAGGQAVGLRLWLWYTLKSILDSCRRWR